MTNESNNMALVPTEKRELKIMFRTNDDGLFNASTLAKEYSKDVYGYTRNQKTKELVKQIAIEYNHDPEQEFTDQGSIVRVITGGTAPGTWMHMDIFIKFLGWLDSKLERDFMKTLFTANKKRGVDPLQVQLARLEAEATTLRKRLARNPTYKTLQFTEKCITKLKKEIEKESKSKRKVIAEGIKKEVLLIGNVKP